MASINVLFRILFGFFTVLITLRPVPSLAITDGISARDSEYPFVVRLDAHGSHPKTGKDFTARGFCSGLLLAPRILVTAEHCAKMIVPGVILTIADGSRSTFRLGSIKASKIELGPALSDLAIVILESDASIHGSFAELGCQSPRENERLALVGFGRTNDLFSNRFEHSKHYGYNFPKCDNNVDNAPIGFENDLSKLNDSIKALSFALPGDSGGPAVGPDGKTIYGIGWLDIATSKKNTYSGYSPVYSSIARQFFQDLKRKYSKEFSSVKLCPAANKP